MRSPSPADVRHLDRGHPSTPRYTHRILNYATATWAVLELGTPEDRRRELLVAPPGVAGQRAGSGRVHRDQPVPAGLGAADGEHPSPGPWRRPVQSDGLAQAQPGLALRRIKTWTVPAGGPGRLRPYTAAAARNAAARTAASAAGPAATWTMRIPQRSEPMAEASLARGNGDRPYDDPSVTDLVTRARNGDKQAWDEIVERYAPLIWSICRRYRLGDADAEDVGQMRVAAPGGPSRRPPRSGRAARLAGHHDPAAMLPGPAGGRQAAAAYRAAHGRGQHAGRAKPCWPSRSCSLAERHAALREAMSAPAPRLPAS